MKTKYITVVIMFATTFLVAQDNFEGVITYDLEFHDKTGEMDDEEASEFMGNQQIYYIKENKYKAVMNGMLQVTQYYTGKDTIYTKMNGVNALMYIDTKKVIEKVISASIKENQLKVAGYNCNLLEIKTNEGTVLYYYNKDIKANTENYKKHQYGLWYYCLNKTGGALPLKMYVDAKDLKLSITAKTVEKKKLETSIFEIPKDLPIVKSPE